MNIDHARGVAKSLGISVEPTSVAPIVDMMKDAYRQGAAQSGGSPQSSRALHNCQTQLQVAIGHLHAILNESRTAAESWSAEKAGREWLRSIGSEPT